MTLLNVINDYDIYIYIIYINTHKAKRLSGGVTHRFDTIFSGVFSYTHNTLEDGKLVFLEH